MRAADHPVYFRIFDHKQSMNIAGTPDDLGKIHVRTLLLNEAATFVPGNGLYYTVPQWWPYDTYLS